MRKQGRSAPIRAAAVGAGTEGHAVTGEPFDNRLDLIHSRFRQASLNGAGSGLWEHWDWSHGSFIASFYILLVMFFLEPALWFAPWPPAPFNRTIPDPIAFSLLFSPLLAGWLLDRYLSLKTPGEATFPRWLLGLRFLAASLPILELYILPVWRAFLLHREPEKLGPRYHVASLSLSRGRSGLPRGLRTRRLYESGFFMVAPVCWLPLLIFWACWLANTSALGSHRRIVILVTCAALHIVFFAATAYATRQRLRELRAPGWKKILTCALLFGGLLPFPAAMASFAIPMFLETSRTSLIWSAYARRADAARLPPWAGLQGALRHCWQRLPWFLQWRRPAGLEIPERATQSDTEVTALYRLKALLLLLDGAALFQGLAALAARASNLAPKVDSILRWVAFVAIALAITGLILQGVGSFARVLRLPCLADELSRHPYGRYLLSTQLALLAGLGGACLARAGYFEQFGSLLCWCSAFCGSYIALCLVMQSSAPSRGLSLWGYLFLAFLCLGGLIYLDAGNRQQIFSGLYILTSLSPLWSLGVFLALGGWLLRPFSWRHVLDRRLPWQFRAALAL